MVWLGQNSLEFYMIWIYSNRTRWNCCCKFKNSGKSTQLSNEFQVLFNLILFNNNKSRWHEIGFEIQFSMKVLTILINFPWMALSSIVYGNRHVQPQLRLSAMEIYRCEAIKSQIPSHAMLTFDCRQCADTARLMPEVFQFNLKRIWKRNYDLKLGTSEMRCQTLILWLSAKNTKIVE